MVRAGVTITKERVFDAVWTVGTPASVTVTTTEAVPATVVLPLI